MAICSDLDETPDARVYFETIRFLNGTDATSMGRGLGLEVGNTIYFEMPPGHFSYWNAGEREREQVRALIGSGHVDCLHSFGDLATERGHAERALEELERNGCRLRVWVDHGRAPTNFGGDIMKGEGDLPGARAYHADLTLAYGIRYVWRGRVTSIVGQGIPRHFGGIFRPGHALSSARTLGKELVKGWSGALFGGKFEMHSLNSVVRDVVLRNGGASAEFLRCNPHWRGVSHGETGAGIPEVLTPGFLDLLEMRGGACVLYTHLGKIGGGAAPFGTEAIRALRNLAERVADRRILLTTTRRLLEYVCSRDVLRFSAVRDGGELRIRLEGGGTNGTRGGGADLSGLTFYVPDPAGTRLFSGEAEVGPLQRNPADATGRGSVSVPWEPLRFPGI